MSSSHDLSINASYWTQYTALILIILTFTIGAFVRGPVLKDKVVLHPKEISVDAPQERLESTLVFSDLFHKGSNINAERANALVSFLKQHDLVAEFEMTVSQSGEELGYEKALVLSEALSELPPHAFRIYLRKDSAAVQAKNTAVELVGDANYETQVRFYRAYR